MLSEKRKNHILAFLPVMKELELMGRNPIEDMFAPKFDMEMIEANYVAICRASKKYPEWNKVISKWVSERMKGIGNE